MKIVIDARLYGMENSGIGRYLNGLISGLTKIDKTNKYFILLRSKYFNQLKLPANWKKVVCNEPVYGLSEQITMPKVLLSINPDITHFPHFNVPIFWKGKFVVTIHDMLMHSRTRQASSLSAFGFFLKNIAYRLVFRHAVKKAECVFTPSHFVEDQVIKYYKVPQRKVAVTYEGFDKDVWTGKHPLDILRQGELIPQKYFVYVGSLSPHKNVHSIVHAIRLLKKHSGGEIKLAIIGPKNIFLGRFIEFLQKEKATDLVRVLGFVKDADISAVYKNSLGFVYPSLGEGFGLQGLEAMSSGTLVLCSDIQVFHEIYGKNATYFDPNDPLEVAKKMERVLRLTKKSRSRIISMNKNFVKKYSWEKMAKQTLERYKKL